METLTPKALELAKDGQTEPVNLRVCAHRLINRLADRPELVPGAAAAVGSWITRRSNINMLSSSSQLIRDPCALDATTSSV